MRELDVKIGGNEIDRLRRGQAGETIEIPRMAKLRFPQTSSPRMIAKLIRQESCKTRDSRSSAVRGKKHGKKEDLHLLIRSDCVFPTLYQIRRKGLFTTPVAYATAHVATLFIKFFPAGARGCVRAGDAARETRRHSSRDSQ